MGHAIADAGVTGGKAKSGSLLRVLGVVFGLAVIIGNTIGGGIFRTPQLVATQLPVAWMFLAAWVIGGCYALLGANSVAELGAAIPRAGGQYAFATRALGKYPGFVVGLSDWLSTCSSVTAISLVIAEYLPAFVPALAGRTVSTAAVVILIVTVVNWRGVVWGGRTQEITSLLKTLGFFALIAACFLLGGRATPAPAPAGAPRSRRPIRRAAASAAARASRAGCRCCAPCRADRHWLR